MNKLYKFVVLRGVAAILILASVGLLFTNWLTLRSSSMRKEAKSAIRSLSDQLGEVGHDELEYFEDMLDDADIKGSPKKMLKQFKKIIGTAKDCELSPAEVAYVAPDILSLLNVFKDEDDREDLFNTWIFRYYEPELSDVVDELESYKFAIVLYLILIVATVSVGIVTSILHFMGKQNRGIVYAILQFITVLVYAIAAGAINEYTDSEFDREILNLSVWPWIGLVLSLAALTIWIYREKVAKKAIIQNASINAVNANNNAYNVGNAGQPPVMMPVVICPNCNTAYYHSIKFCGKCGTPIPMGTSPQ